MTLLIFSIIIIIITGIILTAIKTKNKTEKERIEEDIPVKRKKLLSDAELNFYQILRKIIPENREISCKSRLEDIMYIENKPKKEAYRSKIKSRHVDFLIYDPKTGYTDFAVELDDKSHETEKQKNADQFKDKIFQKINMPLIRIKAQKKYEPSEIIKIIEERIK